MTGLKRKRFSVAISWDDWNTTDWDVNPHLNLIYIRNPSAINVTSTLLQLYGSVTVRNENFFIFDIRLAIFYINSLAFFFSFIFLYDWFFFLSILSEEGVQEDLPRLFQKVPEKERADVIDSGIFHLIGEKRVRAVRLDPLWEIVGDLPAQLSR